MRFKQHGHEGAPRPDGPATRAHEAPFAAATMPPAAGRRCRAVPKAAS